MSYLSFAQRANEIKAAGYWPINFYLEEYWILKTYKVKLATQSDLDVDEYFDYSHVPGNEGYYYSLTSLIDGAKVAALFLTFQYFWELI